MEAAARPNLSLVVDPNGEVVEQDSAAELRIINRRMEAELRGYRLRFGLLEDKKAEEPDVRDERVERVLEYWADQVVDWGWWSRRPFYGPKHKRWHHCHARLLDVRKDGSHPYDEDYLMQVVDGAVSQKRTPRMKQAYLDAKSIFLPDNLEVLYEQGVGVREARAEAKDRELEERVRAHLRSHVPEFVEAIEQAERQECEVHVLAHLDATVFEEPT